MLNKILLVFCTIISFKNHNDNDNNNDNDCHHHHCPLKHDHITEFSFALMETLLGEDQLKFCLFFAQLFHLTIMITNSMIECNFFLFML
jgi:hypothetical protein